MQMRWSVFVAGVLLASTSLGAQQRSMYSSDVKIRVSKEPPQVYRVDVKGSDNTIDIRSPEPLRAFRLEDYMDMDEKQLTYFMTTRDTVEIQLARLAQQKATDPNVRNYAAQIEQYRTAKLREDWEVITEDHVGFAPRPNDYDLDRLRQIYVQLDSMPSGPSWDAAFLKTQYFIHENEYQAINANIKNAHDDDLEELIYNKQKVLINGRDTAWALAQTLGVSIP